ncbi:MAG TPA: hypothetical protein VLT34_19560, partial [Arthrobacter sp.]|nr:hypothetical protein [Arthrobacter sp.]
MRESCPFSLPVHFSSDPSACDSSHLTIGGSTYQTFGKRDHMSVTEDARELHGDIIRLRREFHQEPEIG